jgi:hypothetical protein
MNYIYGSNKLAVKSILKDEYADEEMDKFVGAYEPHIWLPKNRAIMDAYLSHQNIDLKYIDLFIDRIVISCLITHYNLINFGGYKLDRIDIKKVLEDLETMLFSHITCIYGNGTSDSDIIKTYRHCNNIKKNFFKVYISIYHKFTEHWNNGKPDNVITDLFPEGYFYRKRAKRHEKSGSKRTDWSWLDNSNNEDIAREIIRRNIKFERTTEKAFQKRQLSIKDIKKEITRINEEDIPFVYDCAISNWFNSMTTEQKNFIINSVNNVMNKIMSKDDFRRIAFAYGYKEEWFNFFNCVNLKPIQTLIEEASPHSN